MTVRDSRANLGFRAFYPSTAILAVPLPMAMPWGGKGYLGSFRPASKLPHRGLLVGRQRLLAPRPPRAGAPVAFARTRAGGDFCLPMRSMGRGV
jgi:hypothetical protein